MRILYLNGVLIDLDDNTAIGIDLQTYDIKDPAKPKVNVSNSFSIPITNNNLKAIGFIGGIQSRSTLIYETGSCNYFINNIQYVKDAKFRVQSIQDRIELFTFQKEDIWNTLKKVKWADFEASYFAWLNCPKVGSEYTGTVSNFIDLYIAVGGSENLFLPLTNANNSGLYYLTLSLGTESGGAIHSFVKSVFTYLEETYLLDFYTTSSFDGNIWDDAIGSSMYWNFRNIYPRKNVAGFYFDLITSTIPVSYLGTDLVEETRDKTLYDFIISFCQYLNLMIISTDIGFKMVRFDDIETYGGVTDFSGMMEGIPKYKPYVEGYAQNNNITFATVETGINPLLNSKTITCLNQNLEVSTDLFKINAFMPQFTTRNGLFSVSVPDLSTKDSFNNFKFFVNGDGYAGDVTVLVDGNGGIGTTTKTTMKPAAIYDLNSEYTLLNTIMQYPVFYEIKKWMNATTIKNLDFFKLYYFKELGGSYYINKIKGFNPELSKQATTIELIKVSNRVPDVNYIVPPYWVDGLGNIFTDGNDNKFI